MTSKQRHIWFWLSWLVIGLLGCGPAVAPTPAKVDNSRCKITSLTLNSILQTDDIIRLKSGSQAQVHIDGETVGIYVFPSKRGRLLKPPAGSKAGTKVKELNMALYASFVRAGTDSQDRVESYCKTDSIESVIDCDERSYLWSQKIQVPSRRGTYEFRITAYWLGEPKVEPGEPETVEPGVPYTAKSDVLGTWKAIVE